MEVIEDLRRIKNKVRNLKRVAHKLNTLKGATASGTKIPVLIPAILFVLNIIIKFIIYINKIKSNNEKRMILMIKNFYYSVAETFYAVIASITATLLLPLEYYDNE